MFHDLASLLFFSIVRGKCGCGLPRLNRNKYTLREASHRLGASPQAIKSWVLDNHFPHGHDNKGRMVLDLLALVEVYQPRYWYAGKPTGVAYAEERNKTYTARYYAERGALYKENEVVSLDQLMSKGYGP